LLERTLRESWRREMEAASLYQACAERETDPRRRDIFRRLADLEFRHAKWWQDKLAELGAEVPRPDELTARDVKNVSPEQALTEIEAIERGNADWYKSLRHVLDDPQLHAVIDQIEADEAEHAEWGADLAPTGSGDAAAPSQTSAQPTTPTTAPPPTTPDETLADDARPHGPLADGQPVDGAHTDGTWSNSQRVNGPRAEGSRHHGVGRRLQSMWREERWHRQHTGGWVGDAIYGVNDGLGAIFGIIAGVAGYTNSNHTILVSGFFGALASTLSMGAGAWLATKSENELMQSEIQHERQEIAANPEHELEELALLYELKGFSRQEAESVARRIASNPEQFLQTMAQEELGIHEASHGNPWKSALFGGLSTFVGAIIPLVPFFFLTGWVAMLVAAIISLAAHFAVGAAKSLITVRSWWASGLEMTLVGIIVGVVSYGLGLLGSVVLG
jgi:VIT1/CCC1 family predicted Fe2+/Mn2+ transporter/rubrerythrin